MKKRIEWVDVGKYICIMLVMLSHLESRTEVLRTFYTPIYVTMFFFLAGYVYKQSETFSAHMVKKIKGLFVPWLILSNFNILLSSVMTLKNNHNLKRDLILNAIQIRALGDGLWFVAALFVAFIPFYFVIKMGNMKKAILYSFLLSLLSNIYTTYMPMDILPWGSSALPWHLEYIFKAMFWMVLGYYYRNHFEELLEKYNTLAACIFTTAIYLIIVYGTRQFDQGLAAIALGYITSLVGFMFLTLICKRIKVNRYISYVGANTIIFFALHGKVFAVIERVLASVLPGVYSTCLNNVFYSSVLAVVITLIMSIILIAPAYVINRWFPWVIGRKSAKNI